MDMNYPKSGLPHLRHTPRRPWKKGLNLTTFRWPSERLIVVFIVKLIVGEVQRTKPKPQGTKYSWVFPIGPKGLKEKFVQEREQSTKCPLFPRNPLLNINRNEKGNSFKFPVDLLLHLIETIISRTHGNVEWFVSQRHIATRCKRLSDLQPRGLKT